MGVPPMSNMGILPMSSMGVLRMSGMGVPPHSPAHLWLVALGGIAKA